MTSMDVREAIFDLAQTLTVASIDWAGAIEVTRALADEVGRWNLMRPEMGGEAITCASQWPTVIRMHLSNIEAALVSKDAALARNHATAALKALER